MRQGWQLVSLPSTSPRVSGLQTSWALLNNVSQHPAVKVCMQKDILIHKPRSQSMIAGDNSVQTAMYARLTTIVAPQGTLTLGSLLLGKGRGPAFPHARPGRQPVRHTG